MKFFTSISRVLGSAKKAVGDSFSGTWLPWGGTGFGGVNDRNLLEANQEWVFVAVNKLATSVAGIRFKVMRYQRNGDDQEVFDGPLVKFLESPGSGFTGKDFIYLNTVYKELTGNAFWEKDKAGKVKPLIPTRVTPVLANGQLIGFKYLDGANQRTIMAKDLLHDRYIDPAKPYWGTGKLQKIARWVDTSSFVGEFLSRFFVNGATFGGFIETEEESEQRIKLIKIGLQNEHVGLEKSHKIGVLPKGAKFSKNVANMAEMEMGATDDRYRDKILAAFGVPKTLVGLTTEVNRASAEASEYIFAKYTVKPIVDDLVEFLNVYVSPTLETSGRYYFAYDDFVPIDQELALKTRESALGKQPYMTVNEVRATAGLPKIPGGDVVYFNPTLAPLGAPEQAPAPANDNPDDKTPKKAIPARLRTAETRERLIDGIVSKAVELVTAHSDPDEMSHKAFVGRVEAHELMLADKVRSFNNQQERELMLNLTSITKGIKKGDLFDLEREATVMVDFVSPLLRGLMLEQAIEEFIANDFPGTLDQSQPRISTIVQLAARRLAKSYNRTTATLLADTLNAGIEQGEPISALSARVRQVYEYSDAVRANAVARTESFYIANEGSREAYRQSGVVKSMRWYTAEDERVCPWCGPQNGRIIGVEEVFFKKGETLSADGKELKLDYRAIDVPPLHAQCRCFIRPESIDIG